MEIKISLPVILFFIIIFYLLIRMRTKIKYKKAVKNGYKGNFKSYLSYISIPKAGASLSMKTVNMRLSEKECKCTDENND